MQLLGLKMTVRTNATTISSESLESVKVPGRSRWWIDKLQDHDRNRLPLKYSFQLLSVFDRHKMEQHLNLISCSHQSDSQEFHFPSIFESHCIKDLPQPPPPPQLQTFWKSISELATLLLNFWTCNTIFELATLASFELSIWSFAPWYLEPTN